MAKYVSKPSYIEAVLFEAGMHDGYACYDNISGKFIGFHPKDRYPKVMKRNYAIKLYNRQGDFEWFEVDANNHMIITYPSGYRSVMSQRTFNNLYEKVED